MAFEQTHGTWGCRLRTHKFANGIVTLLFLEPGQRCSWHKHDSTWNQFVCVSGKLGVKTEKGYTTTLTEKQAFTVEPGVLHEFQTYELPTIVEEIAWVQYDENDIQRKRIGGPLPELRKCPECGMGQPCPHMPQEELKRRYYNMADGADDG